MGVAKSRKIRSAAEAFVFVMACMGLKGFIVFVYETSFQIYLGAVFLLGLAV